MDTNSAAWQRCFRKRLFWTEEDAHAHMLRLWRDEGSTGLEVYPCEIGVHGPHFHVGHPPRNRERKQKLTRLRTFGRDTVLTREQAS
jgi:hypothetical protein